LEPAQSRRAGIGAWSGQSPLAAYWSEGAGLRRPHMSLEAAVSAAAIVPLSRRRTETG